MTFYLLIPVSITSLVLAGRLSKKIERGYNDIVRELELLL